MAKRRGIGGHQKKSTPARDTYITPEYIIEALGPFDLDPCEALNQPWPCAKRTYNIRQNGLKQPWLPAWRVWCNPPYSNPAPFLELLAKQRNGIACIFGRTETALWQQHVWYQADAILFLEGRLTFFRPTGQICGGNSGGPSAFIAYGQENVARLRQAGFPGALVTRWEVLKGPTDGDRRKAERRRV